MKDFIKNLFQSTNERGKHPFVFAFIISWAIFNWKAIAVLLFYDTNIIDKIAYIDSNYVEYNNNFVFPLSFALFFIIIMPYLSIFLEWLVKKSDKLKSLNQKNKLINSLKDKQDVAYEEKKYEDIRAGNLEISALNDRIIELMKSNEDKASTINSLKKEIEKYNSETSEKFMDELLNEHIETVEPKYDKDYRKFIKEKISQYFKSIGFAVLSHNYRPKAVDEIIVQKYLALDIIEESYEDEDVRITFTDKGRYYWKQFMLDFPIEDEAGNFSTR